METLNFALFNWINAGPDASVWTIGLARMVARFAVPATAVWMVAAWIRGEQADRIALLDAGMAGLAGLGLAQVIGFVWYHPRPFEIGLGRQLLAHALETSFPSDHGTLMVALAVSVLRSGRMRPAGLLLAVAAVSVAWSRVYLGVHFPLDMAGAAVVAGVAVTITERARTPLHRVVYPLCLGTYERVAGRLRR